MIFASNDDIDQILAQIDLRDPLGRRDLCALILARNLGLRVAELVALNVFDVAVGREVRPALYVRPETAKYRSARVIPLNAAAREAVASCSPSTSRAGSRSRRMPRCWRPRSTAA